ncbi:hypothetical protein AgCh_025953 [Apium graveolens]
MDVVNSNLGGLQIQICEFAQYSLLFGLTIGYTIITSTSIQLFKCGNDKACGSSNNLFILIYGVGTKKAYKRKLHVYKKGKARMVELRRK